MKRRLAAGAVVLAALSIWWWQRGGEGPARATGATRAAAAPVQGGPGAAAVSVGTSRVDESELPPPRPDPRTAPPQPPIIDEVTVEKREICEGEETLVSVRAHTFGGADDDHLHYLIGGQTGRQVAIVGAHRQSDDGAPPPRTVMVFGRDNVAAEAPIPAITVKDCQVPRRVHIHTRLLPNTTDEIELYAQVIDVGAAARMSPRRARWRFGDGQSGESGTPTISHDYGARPQDTLFSQFLVEVEVEGDSGELVRGRTSLQLLNSSFEHRHYRGLVLLRAALDPRFPVLDGDGVVKQDVRVFHDHDAAVTLTRVIRRVHRVDGSEEAEELVAPGVLFGGATTLAARGRGVVASLALDTRADPYVFSIEYVLEGKSADGLPAQGGFAVMRPPELPTRERSEPVADPALRARIVRAREVLQRDYVTDEDLLALERAGTFADLPPVGTAPEPAPGGGKGAPAIAPPR